MAEIGKKWYVLKAVSGKEAKVKEYIEGLKGGKSRITIEKPLVVYKEPNVYTDEIYEIYGDKPRNNGK